MSRYFIDERTGYIAVRDRNLTNKDAPGFHSDMEGVIWVWSAKRNMKRCPACGNEVFDGYTISESDRKEAKEMRDGLNKKGG